MMKASNPLKPKKKLSKGVYVLDAKLKALVNQYVQQHKEELIFADDVLGFLLQVSPEYSRKNQNSLKHSIMKVLETLKVKGFWKDTDLSDEEFSNPDAPLVEATDHNFLNNSLVSAYKGNQNTSKPSTPSKSLQDSTELNGNAERRKQPEPEANGTSELSDASHADVNKKKKRRIRSTQSTDKDDMDSIVKSGLVNREIQPSPIPSVGYESLGGIENILQDVRELIEWPMLYPPVYNELRVPAAKGILLHGPPGCGKTLLAQAIAGELGRKLKEVKGEDLTFFKLSAPELVSGMSGESEANLRNLFKIAMANEPCLMFIDEIDVICTKRENASKEMERRIVAQLLTSFDGGGILRSNKRVLVVGSTNRIESLDPSLRRNGRFDKEIPLGVPDEAARAKIIQVHANKVKIQGNFDYVDLARRTPGFVGADLAAITTEAAAAAVKRIISSFESHPEILIHNANSEAMQVDSAPSTPSLLPSVHTFLPPLQASNDNNNSKPSISIHQDNNTITTFDHIAIERTISNMSREQLSQLCITMEDFIKAIKKVQPSAKREGFATIPNVSWEDVGALGDIRHELEKNIIQPIKFPWKFRQAGLEFGGGVLLYGPPGCGKTLLAKAIAHDCSASFISVKGPELLNKFVGESERAVRKVFERAKLSAPCIIFFDELDALCPRRDDEGNAVSARVVNQLLTEMDGLEDRKAIYVIAATNRPDMIDPAMLRHQRLGKLLYVPLPDELSRLDILKTLTRSSTMSNVDLVSVAKRCVRFSGADLAALVKEAKLSALCRDMESTEEDQKPIIVTSGDFEDAFRKVGASVSAEEEKKYLELAKQRETRK